MKRSPLVRKTPLKRGKPIGHVIEKLPGNRVVMSLGPRRQSKRRRKQRPAQARMYEAIIKRADGRCEFEILIGQHWIRCMGIGWIACHAYPRAQFGPTLQFRAAAVALGCAWCHDVFDGRASHWPRRVPPELEAKAWALLQTLKEKPTIKRRRPK
jgi:hypothetical protein